MMGALIVRIAILAGGLGTTELGLVTALGHGRPFGWLGIGLGLVLLVAGSAGFMRGLLAGPGNRRGGR
jgi:hypothetical protein